VWKQWGLIDWKDPFQIHQNPFHHLLRLTRISSSKGLKQPQVPRIIVLLSSNSCLSHTYCHFYATLSTIVICVALTLQNETLSGVWHVSMFAVFQTLTHVVTFIYLYFLNYYGCQGVKCCVWCPCFIDCNPLFSLYFFWLLTISW
jgi:hypothetical protein